MRNDARMCQPGLRAWVSGAAAMITFGVACAPAGPSDEPTLPRTVLLQYATAPTSADSVQASAIGAASVTMYPVINSMALVTSVAVSAFASMQPKPTVSDFNTIGMNCSRLSLLVATVQTPTSADSLAVASLGVRVVGFGDAPNWHEVVGDFAKSAAGSVLALVHHLREDPNINVADFDVGPCPTQAQWAH